MKCVLNQWHVQMAHGYSEVYVEHQNGILSVYRENPDTHEAFVLIAHTAFRGEQGSDGITLQVLAEMNNSFYPGQIS